MIPFYKQPHLSKLTVLHLPLSISSSVSTCKRGIPCICSRVPSLPFCLPHQTFILSLCLSEIITARPTIGWNRVMDAWCFSFRGSIVSLHYSSSHHHTVKRKWPENPFLEIIRSAVPGLTIDISERIEVTLS